MLNALASHPMFSPERWDPMSSAKDVLLSIKTFLEVGEMGRHGHACHGYALTGDSRHQCMWAGGCCSCWQGDC